MNIQSLLEHHGIGRNPFAEEDAQTDPVFKEFCISSAYHPVWDKVYGDPAEPATAIVFGPKGSGKTAMRLPIDRHLARYNEEHPESRVFVIRYDDFNPFLDHFSERLSRRAARKPEKVLDQWKLWDHMDSILCLGVTSLVDRVLNIGTSREDSRGEDAITATHLKKLDRTASRDFLLLAMAYDQSTASTSMGRWNQLRRKLAFGNLAAFWDGGLAILGTAVAITLTGYLFLRQTVDADGGR